MEDIRIVTCIALARTAQKTVSIVEVCCENHTEHKPYEREERESGW
jgi:hypothetical protein